MTNGLRTRNDGWDARFRLGVIVPHADVGPEAELQAMAPPDVSIHAGRVYFGAMRAGGKMDPKIPHDPVLAFVAPGAIDETLELLAAAPLDAIGLAFTSSAYKLGPAGEDDLVDRLAERARGIPLLSGGRAAAEGLRSLGVHRLALIHPPWFDDALDELGARYFEAQGFEVVHHAPAAIPSDQSLITADAVFEHVRDVARDADGVFIAGNGFRAVGAIARLEHALGIPVLSANQALLWRALAGHVSGRGASRTVHGFGRLFDAEASAF